MAENNLQPERLGEIFPNNEREYVVFGAPFSEDIIEIMRVREAAGQIEMDKRPFTPNYVKAVITIDNQVIPVVDMRDMIISPSREKTKEQSLTGRRQPRETHA